MTMKAAYYNSYIAIAIITAKKEVRRNGIKGGEVRIGRRLGIVEYVKQALDLQVNGELFNVTIAVKLHHMDSVINVHNILHICF